MFLRRATPSTLVVSLLRKGESVSLAAITLSRLASLVNSSCDDANRYAVQPIHLVPSVRASN